MAVAFCPSDYRIGGDRQEYDGGTDADGDAISQRPELLRLVDFYASILAMASHDLRQPLQVIVSVLELLARRVTEGPERAHLECGTQASAQLEEKLEELADALHIYQHSGRILPEPVRVEPIVQRVALQLDGLARRKGVDFRSLATRAVIMSQPVLLDGILRNLARNALDHTSPGGRVLIGCRRGGATVRIEVHDTGEGIPPDQVETIFEPFSVSTRRAPRALGLGCSSSSEQPTPLGIGSSSVRRLVTAHALASLHDLRSINGRTRELAAEMINALAQTRKIRVARLLRPLFEKSC